MISEERVEGLADAHEAVMDARIPMTDREERESGRKTVRRLRALLAADVTTAEVSGERVEGEL